VLPLSFARLELKVPEFKVFQRTTFFELAVDFFPPNVMQKVMQQADALLVYKIGLVKVSFCSW
jgi:hypothetical protein